MTRFLCVGDLHIGAGPDYGREPGDRLLDQEEAWHAALEIGLQNNVDAVIFAGDAFHRRRPTPAELRAFQRPIYQLAQPNRLPIVAINGNHDVESADLPSALDIFHRDIDLHARPGVTRIGDVSVVTLPWTPIGRFIAAQNGGDRDELNLTAAELLVRSAADLRAQIDGPAVLVLHWSVSGASTPSGVQTDDFREVTLDADALAALGFDAVVCGHIHKAQDFNSAMGWMDASVSRPGEPFFYTGSLLPVDFGEANTPHGVWLLDVDDQGARAEFLPVPSRPFVTVDVDLTTDAPEQLDLDETDAVAAAIATHLPLTDAVIRLRYRASEEQARAVDQGALRALLEDAGIHKLYSINPEIIRGQRSRIEPIDEDMTPVEAVRMYSDAMSLQPWEIDSLNALTEQYLEAVR